MNIPTKDVDIDNESIGIARTLGDVEQLLRDLGMPVKALMETLTESPKGFHMKRGRPAGVGADEIKKLMEEIAS